MIQAVKYNVFVLHYFAFVNFFEQESMSRSANLIEVQSVSFIFNRVWMFCVYARMLTVWVSFECEMHRE
uniref:Uncharacterized protein n=1 Tax=Anguilla anguilla TaxID=7936 RepID=A0A0E9X0I6_ANGAN